MKKTCLCGGEPVRGTARFALCGTRLALFLSITHAGLCLALSQCRPCEADTGFVGCLKDLTGFAAGSPMISDTVDCAANKSVCRIKYDITTRCQTCVAVDDLAGRWLRLFVVFMVTQGLTQSSPIAAATPHRPAVDCVCRDAMTLAESRNCLPDKCFAGHRLAGQRALRCRGMAMTLVLRMGVVSAPVRAVMQQPPCTSTARRTGHDTPQPVTYFAFHRLTGI